MIFLSNNFKYPDVVAPTCMSVQFTASNKALTSLIWLYDSGM